MEIKEMQITDVESRLAQIEELLTSEDADVEALTEEVDALQQRKIELKAEAEEKRAMMAKVAELKQPEVIEERKDLRCNGDYSVLASLGL